MKLRHYLKTSIYAGILIFVFLACHICISAQDKEPLDGYWRITAEFADYDLNSIVRFRTDKDGQTVEGISLGPTGGRGSPVLGKINGKTLSFKTSGPDGEMQITLTLAGKNMSGTWTSRTKQGKVSGTRIKARQGDPDYYEKYLSVVLNTLTTLFFDPRFNGIDIEKLRAKYTAQLAGVKDDADFVVIVRKMLLEFKTSHTDFYLSLEERPLKEKTPIVAARKINDQVGYLRIRSFAAITLTDEGMYYQSLEKGMVEINPLPGLIVDLRGNRGGELGILLKTLGYFIPAGSNAAHIFSNKGADKAAEFIKQGANIDPKFSSVTASENLVPDLFKNGASTIKITGSEDKRYRGKTVILTDENCYSACEIFASVMQETGRGVVIGQQTKGEVLGSFTDRIIKNMIFRKKDTGWRFEVPIFDIYTIKRNRLEGKGLTPDIAVKDDQTQEKAMTAALKYLEKK